MILRLSLDLPEEGAYVSLARQFSRGLLEYLRVVPQDTDDVETIVAELVANVIRHAQSVEGRFQVLLEYHADRAVITVVDVGPGFTFRDVPEIGSPAPTWGAASAWAASACRCWTRWRTGCSSPAPTRTARPCAPRSVCTTRPERTPPTRAR